MLEYDYLAIKESIKKEMPFENGVNNKIEEIEKAIEKIDQQISLIPTTSYIALDDKKRLVLLGEIKNKFLELINSDISTNNIEESIKITETNINKLELELIDYEENKKNLINNPKHLIIESAHPSPLSAYNGFFGSKPFSKTNSFLKKNNLKEIDWQIENI